MINLDRLEKLIGKKTISKVLFPGNKHPVHAYTRISNGASKTGLSYEQLTRLAMWVGVPLVDLESNFFVIPKQHTIDLGDIFIKYDDDYIRVFDKNSLKYKKIKTERIQLRRVFEVASDLLR